MIDNRWSKERQAEAQFLRATELSEVEVSTLKSLPESLVLSIMCSWVEAARANARMGLSEWDRALSKIRDVAKGTDHSMIQWSDGAANAAPDGPFFGSDRLIGYAISEIAFIAQKENKTYCRYKNTFRQLSETASSVHEEARLKLRMLESAAEMCRLYQCIGDDVAKTIKVRPHH
jgi:hypothetical protein